MRLKKNEFWACYIDGELDYNQLEMADGYVYSPALFKRKSDAQGMYTDIRKVKITLSKVQEPDNGR